MRTKLLVLFILLFSKVSFAQITKGAVLTGGSVSLSISNSNDDDPSSITSATDRKDFFIAFEPNVGIFLSEKWLFQGGLTYVHNTVRYTSYVPEFDGTHTKTTQKSVQSVYGISASMVRYFRVKGNFFFTLDFNAGAGITKNKTDYNGGTLYDYDGKRLSFHVAPGLTYFINNRWAATASIGSAYAQFNWMNRDKPETAVDNFSSSFGLSLQANTFSIGVQYLLRNGEE